MAFGLKQRKSVRNLTVGELTSFRAAMWRLQEDIRDERGFNAIAGLHGRPGNWCWHHGRAGRGSVPPGVRLFLPWHRAYLYRLEQSLQDQDPSVTQPWWNWASDASRQTGVPRAYQVAMADGRRNPLAASRIRIAATTTQPAIDRLSRRFPGNPAQLPSAATVESLLALTDWRDFNAELEGIHDGIHGWAGGSGAVDGQIVSGDMGMVATAAYDPIFWAHHCMIDRLWWLWQLRHGINTVPANMLDLPLAPFEFRVRDVLNIHDLGYDYAGAEATASAAVAADTAAAPGAASDIAGDTARAGEAMPGEAPADGAPPPQVLRTGAIALPLGNLESRPQRVDLELRDIDSANASFAVDVFLNNDSVDTGRPATEQHGHVGTVHIFGHGGCFGDEGHCEPPPARPYDRRYPPAYLKVTKRLIVSDYMTNQPSADGNYVVTVVARPIAGRMDTDIDTTFRFAEAALITYD